MKHSANTSDPPAGQHVGEELASITILPPILYNSPELAAWHEAGHVETALRVGAKVMEVKLYRDPARSYGRTRVDRTNEQGMHIALGGFAVEVLLFLQGRLRSANGSPLNEKEFIDNSIRNATEDYHAFWKLKPGLANSLNEKERDTKFMAFARGMAETNMDISVVERIASALLASNFLTTADLMAALQDELPGIAPPARPGGSETPAPTPSSSGTEHD